MVITVITAHEARTKTDAALITIREKQLKSIMSMIEKAIARGETSVSEYGLHEVTKTQLKKLGYTLKIIPHNYLEEVVISWGDEEVSSDNNNVE